MSETVIPRNKFESPETDPNLITQQLNGDLLSKHWRKKVVSKWCWDN